MPLYEFHCKQCDVDFEQLMRSDENPECPDCGTSKVEKLFSVPAAHSGTSELPIAGGCGRPQCGTGGCQGLG